MYESEKNEIVLKDEYKALYPVIGAGDEEDDGIFLKKHGGNIYLCGSSYAIAIFMRMEQPSAHLY